MPHLQGAEDGEAPAGGQAPAELVGGQAQQLQLLEAAVPGGQGAGQLVVAQDLRHACQAGDQTSIWCTIWPGLVVSVSTALSSLHWASAGAAACPRR